MKNTLKKKLQSNQLSVGSWITLFNPFIPEVMARAGFEWLTVDMEHSAITLSEAQILVQSIEATGCIPLIRVGENNANLIKRSMDTGAGGVIVPMVNTKEDALKAVQAVKYPPLGTRGVGLSRAQKYGFGFEEYKEWVNKDSVVIVQIEHIKGVENIEKILSVEGVDGFIVGPYDLSGSLGRPGEFDYPKVKESLKKVLDVSQKMNKPAGFHVIPPDANELSKKIAEGYTFLAFSLDTLFLGDKCIKEMKKVKK